MATVSVKPRVLGEIAHPAEAFEAQLVDAVDIGAGNTLRITLPEAATPVQPPAAQTMKKKKRVLWPLLSLIAVGLGGWVIPAAWDRGLYAEAATVVAGVSIFAGIYAGAQSIERLLEPFSHWIKPNEDAQDAYGKAVEAADKAVVEWAADNANASKRAAAEAAMKTMAEKKDGVDENTEDRTAIFWGIATILGMLASAGFGLFLLKLIGVSSSYGWDVFATGLILGSGSKPVHDVISKVKSGSDDSDSEGGSTTKTDS